MFPSGTTSPFLNTYATPQQSQAPLASCRGFQFMEVAQNVRWPWEACLYPQINMPLPARQAGGPV